MTMKQTKEQFIGIPYDELEAENEKLRELLSSYWKRVHSPAAPNVERDYLAEMRELGVEVDE